MRKSVLLLIIVVAIATRTAAAGGSTAAKGASAQSAAADAAVPPPAGDVTAVRVGSRVVYRYKDVNGHIVLLDQPPPGHAATKFENMAPPVADAPQPEATARTAEPASNVASDEKLLDRVLHFAPWLALPLVLAGLLAWSLPRLIGLVRRLLARRRTLTSVLDRSGYDTMHGVILPLAGGRTAFVDHIVRTPSGLLVIGSERGSVDTRHVTTKESGSASTRDPREIGREVAKVDARVEAIKALVPDVPVFGRFVCTGNVPADGTVTRVMTLPRLAKALPNFRRDDTPNSVALNAAWHKLQVCAGRDAPTDR